MRFPLSPFSRKPDNRNFSRTFTFRGPRTNGVTYRWEIARESLLEVEQALEVQAEGMREVLHELDGLDEADVHNKITYLLESLDERHLKGDLRNIYRSIYQYIAVCDCEGSVWGISSEYQVTG